MNINEIDFSVLTPVRVEYKSDRTKIYKGNGYFYKIFPEKQAAHYIQDGLDYIWCGGERMAADVLGLITKKSCPAFVDYIYDKKMCIGYITFEGSTDIDKNKYNDFIEYLVSFSLEKGYGIVDVKADNMIMYKDEVSFIDLNFHPIKLSHGRDLNDYEYQLWVESFCSDNRYTDQLLSKFSV